LYTIDAITLDPNHASDAGRSFHVEHFGKKIAKDETSQKLTGDRNPSGACGVPPRDVAKHLTILDLI